MICKETFILYMLFDIQFNMFEEIFGQENPKSRYNFTPIDIITRITDEVNSGAIKILFVDFDQTFQIWNGAIPFGHPGTIRIFRQNGINIEVIE